MVWPTLGSRTAEEQNRTEYRDAREPASKRASPARYYLHGHGRLVAAVSCMAARTASLRSRRITLQRRLQLISDAARRRARARRPTHRHVRVMNALNCTPEPPPPTGWLAALRSG